MSEEKERELGKQAKQIALYFLTKTEAERYTPAIISKTIVQARSLLRHGYTLEEVIACIDYIVDSGRKIYSFGYINTSINDVLRQIKNNSLKEKKKEVEQAMKEELERRRREVIEGDDTRERNQQKAKGFGSVQSRLGEKFNFDMFEK